MFHYLLQAGGAFFYSSFPNNFFWYFAHQGCVKKISHLIREKIELVSLLSVVSVFVYLESLVLFF